MNDLSLKGIARNKGFSDTFSVREDLFRVGADRPISVRNTLEGWCRDNHFFDREECIFEWQAAFEQTWTHIEIRIMLDPDENVDLTLLDILLPFWESGIDDTWNNKWGCNYSGELPCRLSFIIRWVDAGPHHVIRVSAMGGTTNAHHWHTGDGRQVIAHEFGHLLGLADEYEYTECPDRSPVNTGTIMDTNANVVPSRMMRRFARYINSNVVSI